MYEIAKTLHVLAVIAWMAGLLYLPRLMAYHAAALADPGSSGQTKAAFAATFTTMQHRLLRIIMLPAMIVVWLSGLWTAYELAAWSDGWLHAKLLLVVLMTGAHHVFAAHHKAFQRGQPKATARFYKLVNEIPAILAIGIVGLVILKPF